MTIENIAEEHFKKGFELLRQMPDTKERKDLLERIIECAMRIYGVKNGQSMMLMGGKK